MLVAVIHGVVALFLGGHQAQLLLGALLQQALFARRGQHREPRDALLKIHHAAAVVAVGVRDEQVADAGGVAAGLTDILQQPGRIQAAAAVDQQRVGAVPDQVDVAVLLMRNAGAALAAAHHINAFVQPEIHCRSLPFTPGRA